MALTRKSFQHAINAIEYSGLRADRNSSCTVCVNSSSKYLQSEMGACLTRRDYKESHSPIDNEAGRSVNSSLQSPSRVSFSEEQIGLRRLWTYLCSQLHLFAIHFRLFFWDFVLRLRFVIFARHSKVIRVVNQQKLRDFIWLRLL